MRTGRLPGAGNIVRFPVEWRGRPRLDLRRELAPERRDVLRVLLALSLADPAPDVRGGADADEPARVGPPTLRQATSSDFSPEVQDPTIAEAIAASWAARDAVTASVNAQQRLSRARTTEEGCLDRLRPRAGQTLPRDLPRPRKARASTVEPKGAA